MTTENKDLWDEVLGNLRSLTEEQYASIALCETYTKRLASAMYYKILRDTLTEMEYTQVLIENKIDAAARVLMEENVKLVNTARARLAGAKTNSGGGSA